jgi:peptide/nickel transport system permease protein
MRSSPVGTADITRQSRKPRAQWGKLIRPFRDGTLLKHPTKALRLAATALAAILVFAGVGGSFLSRFDYSVQDREHVNAAASSQHWLGTDDLGRDRLARLLRGTRVSLLLAPAAAAVSVLLALAIGAAPGFLGGFSERAAKTAIDLFLSIPWLFLLLTVRAMLPLNTSPAVSVTFTFLLLGVLGWAAPARILLARARSMRQSDFIIMAHSFGMSPWRLLAKHLLPNLRPILLAQFWVAVPVFILAEANLGLLGLGVAEPLPSLGSLLRELETVISFRADLCRFTALIMLVLIVSGMQIATSEPEVP